MADADCGTHFLEIHMGYSMTSNDVEAQEKKNKRRQKKERKKTGKKDVREEADENKVD